MNLQGRNLSINLLGPDVALLQTELGQLGYTIPLLEFGKQTFGTTTQQAVQDFQRKRGLPANGVVDPVTARAINAAVAAIVPSRFVITGHVRHQDGTALNGVTVRAFDKDLLSEEKLREDLGKVMTDANGFYQISYTAESFRRAEKKSADLIIRAYSPEDLELAASPVIFNAPVTATVDLMVAPLPLVTLSEFEQYLADLSAPMEGTRLADLTDAGIAFLSGETGIAAAHLKFLRLDAQLASETRVPESAFYGWFRENLPTDLDALLALAVKVLTDALLQAIHANIVPASLSQSLPSLMELVAQLQRTRDARIQATYIPHQVVGRLLDQTTGEALVRFRVQGFDLDAGSTPQDLGYDTSNGSGLFGFRFAMPPPIPSTAPVVPQPASTRRLRFVVFGPDGQQLQQTDVTITPDQDQVFDVAVPVPPVVEPPSPLLKDLGMTVGLNIPQPLSDFLASQGIQTLADVLKKGGIGFLPGLPVPATDPAVQTLEAHASLSRLSSDLQLNSTLIAQGYVSVSHIARAPRTDFVTAAGDLIGDFKAAQLHVMAAGQNLFLDNVTTHILSANANGYQGPHPGTIPPVWPVSIMDKCGCEDCEAAVSPLAYLADLLDYAVRHVKNNGKLVHLQDLANAFHQPFGSLPTACDEVDKQVRQVRLCIEVLRSYLKAASITVPPQIETDYCLDAYTTLLNKIGTSYAEIRLARSDTPEKRQSLADRLGIDLDLVGANLQQMRPDNLDALFLDAEATPPAITEAMLEQLFGLVDTHVPFDPSKAASTPALLDWRLKHLHTFWKVQDWPVDLYSDGVLPLELQKLPRPPIIDPDLIGPDDFRNPVAKTNPNAPDQAFDLWQKRRQWVDGQLGAFLKMGKQVNNQTVPDLAAILGAMYQPVSYGAIHKAPWANGTAADWTMQPNNPFETLLDQLTQGATDEVAAAKNKIRTDLNLWPEGFIRIMAVRELDQLQNPPPSADDWKDIYSILVQAQKVMLFEAWASEEKNLPVAVEPAGLLFGPEDFWFSLREPGDGNWPLELPPKQPLIDPELLKLNDLPEPTAGQAAIDLWQQRRDRLENDKKALKSAHKQAIALGTDPLQALLDVALGNPPNNTFQLPAPDTLDTLYNDLNGTDQVRHDHAVTVIQSVLFMSIEDFAVLAGIRNKLDNNLAPAESEWVLLYSVLVSAQKRKRYYPSVWISEEAAAGLSPEHYWQVRNAQLPLWRASPEARAMWQQALRLRSRSPLIDPDLIGPGDLKSIASGNAAFDLWTDRHDKWLVAYHIGLLAQPQDIGGLDTILTSTLGVNKDALIALDVERQNGKSIEKRLEQLTLLVDAFSFLMRIVSLLAANPPQTVLDSEWEQVYSILIQVSKRRRFTRWRLEEQAKGLLLSPDFFQIPPPPPVTFPPQPQAALPLWRATMIDRQDWQDTLQSRIDQEQGVKDALDQVIGATEEATLPKLRDALVSVIKNIVSAVDDPAKWVGDTLLIDAKTDGCAITTRVAQAIETIQNLLFYLREELTPFVAAHKGITLDAPEFDEEWQWIGSYATWRAAMFVFLYPENILIPSLRRWQTPAFRTLVNDLRSNRRLSADQARAAAATYSDYFQDICSLNLEASCQTRTRLYKNGKPADYSYLFYTFARSNHTGAVYYSSYDPADTSDFSQSFWSMVPGLFNVVKIVGAVPYAFPFGGRFIFLFAIVKEKILKKLVYTRYDLEKNSWDEEANDGLELLADANDFSAILMQRYRENAAPSVALQIHTAADSKNTYLQDIICMRSLNVDCSDWEEDDWQPLAGAVLGATLGRPGAWIEISSDDSCFIVTSDKTKTQQYRLLGVRDDALWIKWSTGTVFSGAFLWPKTTDVFMFASSDGGEPSQLVVVKTGKRNMDIHTFNTAQDYVRIFFDSYNKDPYDLKSYSFTKWFEDVVGVDLKSLPVPAGISYQGSRPTIGEAINFVSSELFDSIEKIIKEKGIRDEELGVLACGDSVCRTVFGKSLPDLLQLISEQYSQIKMNFRDSTLDAELTKLLAIPVTTILGGVGGNYIDVSARQFSIQLDNGHVGIYRKNFDRSGDKLSERSSIRIVPLVSDFFDIPDSISGEDLQIYRNLEKPIFKANEPDSTRSVIACMEEAYYFVPIYLALQLQAVGEYTSALDWFRTTYDYSAGISNRKIYYGLEQEQNESTIYQRAQDWLLDPLNPHEIASTRRNTYTRFTVLSIVRCLLEYADAEFTRDTRESNANARLLYLTAQELLDIDELKQHLGFCYDKIGKLDIQIGDPQWLPVWNSMKAQLNAVGSVSTLTKLIDDIEATMGGQGSWSQRFAQANSLIAAARSALPTPPTLAAVLDGKAGLQSQLHAGLMSLPVIVDAASRVGELAGNDLRHNISFISGIQPLILDQQKVMLPWLRQPAAASLTLGTVNATLPNDLQDLTQLNPLAPTNIELLLAHAHENPVGVFHLLTRVGLYIPAPIYDFCIPPNPIPRALRQRAELNLYKLRTCRNIAGMRREIDPYATSTDTTSGMPIIGAGGQLVLPGLATLTPTPYRYQVLIERAKQMVGLAQQIEAAFFSSIEKSDAERYSRRKAHQDVDLARAGVRLQTLRVNEAQAGVTLATLQQQRAQIQVNKYTDWLAKPTSTLEILALVGMETAAVLYAASATSPGAATSAQAQAASSTASLFQYQDSLDRRTEEWKLQLQIATQDSLIAGQQINIAVDHVFVTGQELAIAGIQSDNAEGLVEFLSNKFTNVDLYDWMSGVLGGVYSFFLQQATSIARLAENQLAFERQETPPPFIQDDYWVAPGDMGATTGGAKAPDRRGLTGSARLLQDIYQLDQYSFDTNKRKAQLSKTISLAQLAPAEFQRFRETGVLPFDTRMEMFDREFPGHYLRLIRRIRTSVIALIPPSQGIRATLTTTGTSRVVIGGDIFQTVRVHHNPDQVALSAAQNATGVFELDLQPEMLLPFEGIGVDTHWELRMPKAANPFDYRTIADVLFTIDYTALNSFDYQQQVIQTLRPTTSADRPFSFRNQFADQWYDLHNPDLTATPMTVRFQTQRDDFPPNLDDIKIQQVVLYFARADGLSFEVPVSYLHFTESNSGGTVGGGATTTDGIISTRRGNAGSWVAMIGRSPFGDWELALPNTEEMRNRFKNEDIQEILFVITYSGRTPEWPN